MTLIQEAYSLIQRQPEKNLKLIVDMLRHMVNNSSMEMRGLSDINLTQNRPYRLGIYQNRFNLPEEFYEHFNDDNDEIWADFREDMI